MLKYAKVVNESTGLCMVCLADIDAVWKEELELPADGGEPTTRILYVKDRCEARGMSLLDVDRAYNGSWYLADKVPSKPEPTQAEVIKGYELAVQDHLDKTAQSRGYDNTYTCLSYLSSTDDIWRRESNAFNAWRDRVWRKCHEVLNMVLSGVKPVPTVAELIEQLPVIDWNDPE
jgi:hypothetical protein